MPTTEELATYYAEAKALMRAYDEAVGWCLQYKIPVHVKGQMRPLGDLRYDIRAHEKKGDCECLHPLVAGCDHDRA